ncbi:hypothetical protein BDV12DRAFT_209911 [Aspergillus spectabilis]
MTKQMAKRPKKRTIVRWDENLNELLLLTLQSVCNAQSIRIPWADVATTMGHDTTEGAIVQHLAKLRSRRLQAGKSVPPPLKRGLAAGSSKSFDMPSNRRQKGSRDQAGYVADTDTSDEEWVERRTSKRRKPRTKTKSPPTYYKQTLDVEYKESDSDGELLAPGAKFLELPKNNRHVAPSPSTQPVSKIVSYKCPKHFLASLDSKTSYGDTYHTASIETPVPKPEPTRMNDSFYGSFTSEPVTEPTTISMPAEDLRFFQDSAVHTSLVERTNLSPLVGEGEDVKYIPTGHPATDLPMIGLDYSQTGQDMFSSQYPFDQGSFESLQGFEPTADFQMDQFSYQGMLEEAMLDEQNGRFTDPAWYAELPKRERLT